MRFVGTDKPAKWVQEEPLSEGLMRVTVPTPACQARPSLRGFCFVGTVCVFRGNRVGILNRDSGELSVSASRGGGIAATGCLWWKGHSPDYPTCSVSTDRAATGILSTGCDSLSSSGKRLESPVPMLSRTGYLNGQDSIVTPGASSTRASLGVVLSQRHHPFPNKQDAHYEQV